MEMDQPINDDLIINIDVPAVSMRKCLLATEQKIIVIRKRIIIFLSD